MNTETDKTRAPEAPLQRMPRRPWPELTETLLPGLAGASGLLLGLAMPSLIGADGFFDYVKCGVIGIAGAATSYGVNRLAIERGAPQAAIGLRGAALASTTSILAVGAGMFAATYGGFAVEPTDRLRLEAHAEAQARYIADRTEAAREMARIAPAMRSVAADLAAKEACELQSSCVSGNGDGGAGEAFRALSGERQRAEAIAGEVGFGAAAFEAALAELDRLQSMYGQILADETLGVTERRAQAQATSRQVTQMLGALDESSPAALVSAYAAELAQGSGNPQIDRVRSAHADQLQAVIASADRVRPAPPSQPPRAGVTDALTHIGRFLPIAMIVGVIELVFPITLWLYTYFALVARLAREEAETAPVRGDARKGRRD